MRVMTDVMGGDKAPLESLYGVLSAVSEHDAKVTLVGGAREDTSYRQRNVFPKAFKASYTDTKSNLSNYAASKYP